MDIPIKLNFPRLDHSDLLQLLFPLIPGLIVAASLSSGRSHFPSNLYAGGFGYKTRVVLASLLVYVIGLGIIEATDALTALVFNKIKPLPDVSVVQNRYWKQVVSKYLGPDLTPSTIATKSEVEIVVRSLLNFAGHEENTVRTFENRYESLAPLEEAIAVGERDLATSSKASEERRKVLQDALSSAKGLLQEKKAEIDEMFVPTVTWRDWASISASLSLSLDTPNPWFAFDRLLLSLEAASLAYLTLLGTSETPWSGLGCFLALVVSGSALRNRWLVHQLNVYNFLLSAGAIAKVVNAIKKDSSSIKGKPSEDDD